METTVTQHSSDTQLIEEGFLVSRSAGLADDLGDWIEKGRLMGQSVGDVLELLASLSSPYVQRSSVEFRDHYEPAEASSSKERGITDEDIWAAMIDHDTIVRLSPIRSYVVRAKITKVERGRPHPIEPTWISEHTADH